MKKFITDFYKVKDNGNHQTERAVFCNGGYYIKNEDFNRLFKYVLEALCEYCKHYQTDLLHDIDSIREMVKNPDDIDETYTSYIGIRKNGTDGKNFIEIRLNDPETFGDYPYYAMFAFEMNCNGFNGATLTMYELEKI